MGIFTKVNIQGIKDRISHARADLNTIPTDEPFWDRVTTWGEHGYPTGDLPSTSTLANEEDPVDRLAVRIHFLVSEFNKTLNRIVADSHHLTRISDELGAAGSYDITPIEWCKNCRHNKTNTPAVINGVCSWCSAFRRSEGFLPPVAILRIRHTGGRVTQRDIDQHRPKRTQKTRLKRGA